MNIIDWRLEDQDRGEASSSVRTVASHDHAVPRWNIAPFAVQSIR
jgi:hypothetical protein